MLHALHRKPWGHFVTPPEKAMHSEHSVFPTALHDEAGPNDRHFLKGQSCTRPREHWLGNRVLWLNRAPIEAHNLEAVDREVNLLATHPKVNAKPLGQVEGKTIHAMHVGGAHPKLRIVIIAGIHGNEPGGPAAGFDLIQRILRDPKLLEQVELTFIPVANPVGWGAQTRVNAHHINLNRRFYAGQPHDDAPEYAVMQQTLEKLEVDLALDLHGSWSIGKQGFFALHRGRSLELLRPVMQRFSKRYSIMKQSTERYALDAPGIATSHNQGTFKDYMADVVRAPWSMTLESPTGYDYDTQVRGLAELSELLIREALERITRNESMLRDRTELDSASLQITDRAAPPTASYAWGF